LIWIVYQINPRRSTFLNQNELESLCLYLLTSLLPTAIVCFSSGGGRRNCQIQEGRNFLTFLSFGGNLWLEEVGNLR